MPADKLAVYVPKEKQELKPIERLQKLARRLDRSVNYLVVQAIIEYLDRAERIEARGKTDG